MITTENYFSDPNILKLVELLYVGKKRDSFGKLPELTSEFLIEYLQTLEVTFKQNKTIVAYFKKLCPDMSQKTERNKVCNAALMMICLIELGVMADQKIIDVGVSSSELYAINMDYQKIIHKILPALLKELFTNEHVFNVLTAVAFISLAAIIGGGVLGLVISPWFFLLAGVGILGVSGTVAALSIWACIDLFKNDLAKDRKEFLQAINEITKQSTEPTNLNYMTY